MNKIIVTFQFIILRDWNISRGVLINIINSINDIF